MELKSRKEEKKKEERRRKSNKNRPDPPAHPRERKNVNDDTPTADMIARARV
jgi:hypothetical protein